MGLSGFRGQNIPIPTQIPMEMVVMEPRLPSRSMVSLILLAAFSLSSPGWLLLMEKSVMTPAVEGQGGQGGGTPTVPPSPCWGEPTPTPYEEIAPHDEDEPDGCQDEASPVAVVLVPHEADAADRVTIHLAEMGTRGVSWLWPPFPTHVTLAGNCQDTGSQSCYLRHGQDGHGEDEGDGPGDEVEVGGLAQQWLVGGAQRLEGGVPGVGQHDEPDDTRHQ